MLLTYIAEIYLIIISLCFTFAEPFDDCRVCSILKTIIFPTAGYVNKHVTLLSDANVPVRFRAQQQTE